VVGGDAGRPEVMELSVIPEVGEALQECLQIRKERLIRR
jgi:hypothetical protein